MKILHTSDWHLGKIFHEHSLLEDQRFFLEQLLLHIESERYDVLIIAGDIYDRSIPPVEAVTLLSEFFSKLRKLDSEIHVLVISGNHDSAPRLSYGREVFDQARIHIRTEPEMVDVPVEITADGLCVDFYLTPFLYPGVFHKGELEVRAEQSASNGSQKIKKIPVAQTSKKTVKKSAGKTSGRAAVKNETGSVATLATLEANFKEAGQGDLFSTPPEPEKSAPAPVPDTTPAVAEKENQNVDSPDAPGTPRESVTHENTVREAIRRIRSGWNSDHKHVLVAHLFTHGGEESDSERVFVGTSGHVDKKLFADFDYIALGHLHKPQRIADNIYYAGSPLKYSFSEATHKKGFLKIELTADDLRVEKIELSSLRDMRRLKGAFEDFFSGDKFNAHKKDYLELEFTDENVVLNPAGLLKRKFPHLLSIKQPALNIGEPGALEGRGSVEERGPGEDFRAFFEHLHEEAPSEELLKLFTRVLSEEEENAPQ